MIGINNHNRQGLAWRLVLMTIMNGFPSRIDLEALLGGAKNALQSM